MPNVVGSRFTLATWPTARGRQGFDVPLSRNLAWYARVGLPLCEGPSHGDRVPRSGYPDRPVPGRSRHLKPSPFDSPSPISGARHGLPPPYPISGRRIHGVAPPVYVAPYTVIWPPLFHGQHANLVTGRARLADDPATAATAVSHGLESLDAGTDLSDHSVSLDRVHGANHRAGQV